MRFSRRLRNCLDGGDHRTALVEITGGEPLLQTETIDPARRLVAHGYTTMIETSGERFVGDLPREVVKIVDVKCPDSGEPDAFDFANLEATNVFERFVFAGVLRP